MRGQRWRDSPHGPILEPVFTRARDLRIVSPFTINGSNVVQALTLDFAALEVYEPAQRYGLVEVGILFPMGATPDATVASHDVDVPVHGYDTPQNLIPGVGVPAISTTGTPTAGATPLLFELTGPIAHTVAAHAIATPTDDRNAWAVVQLTTTGRTRDAEHGSLVFTRDRPIQALHWLLDPSWGKGRLGQITFTPQSWTLRGAPEDLPRAYAAVRKLSEAQCLE